MCGVRGAARRGAPPSAVLPGGAAAAARAGDNNGDEKLEASFCRLALTCHHFKNMLEEKMTEEQKQKLQNTVRANEIAQAFGGTLGVIPAGQTKVAVQNRGRFCCTMPVVNFWNTHDQLYVQISFEPRQDGKWYIEYVRITHNWALREVIDNLEIEISLCRDGMWNPCIVKRLHQTENQDSSTYTILEYNDQIRVRFKNAQNSQWRSISEHMPLLVRLIS